MCSVLCNRPKGGVATPPTPPPPLRLPVRMLLSRMQEPLLHIPRCYFHNVEESYPCKLIGFCDASQRAYAAVVFMKVGSAGKCAIRFVASRIRVAPLNSLTIPRLELLAALLWHVFFQIPCKHYSLNRNLTRHPAILTQRLSCIG